MGTFVPFDAGGIPGLELWANGFELTDDRNGVVTRFTVTSGGPPSAFFGRYGPRGGWSAWTPGGDLGELILAVRTVRTARDALETLEDRWITWMQANNYDQGDA